MSKVQVSAFSISLDGFSAGVEQSLENPLGVRGTELFRWFFATETFHRMHTDTPIGSTGIDDTFARKSFENVGAWIMGRNQFGPVRGPWPDDDWKGWWGDTPPFHVPTFVLTNHPRASFTMNGGTTFHFVTDGIESAFAQAKEAAAGKDVRIGGGVSTVRQYLQAGHVDELHLALSPVLLGQGEALLAGINLSSLGFAVRESAQGENATHFVIAKGNKVQE